MLLTLTQLFRREPWNLAVISAGRDLWRSPSPTLPSDQKVLNNPISNQNCGEIRAGRRSGFDFQTACLPMNFILPAFKAH